jgi:hypothetical protein
MARKQSNYSVHLSSATNTKLAIISEFSALQYNRAINTPGSLTLILSSFIIDRSFLTRDVRIEVWRSFGGIEVLETDTQWILRKVSFDKDTEMLTLSCKSGLELINRRIIAYDAGTSQSVKTGLADDIIVEFVDENLGGSATDSARDWSDLILIRSAPGNGPTIHKAASRRNLLKTIQEIAQQATVQGTPTFFDINYLPASKVFEFRTYTQQRGFDRSIGQTSLVFSPEYGNLANVIREDIYTNEITYAYAAGQGQADERVVVSASDTTRIGFSPFGRIEVVSDSRNTSNTDQLNAEAETRVRIGRPIRTFSGQIINKPGSEYGLDWFWGDKVRVEIDGEVLTARIDAIEVSVADGKEDIKSNIRIED